MAENENINSEYAIRVKNVTKQFKVYYDKGSSLKERMIFRGRNRYENRTVLDGISLDIRKGDAVGLVGHNGCGKSTLLKLMTRILYPDSGEIEVQGRVSSLIELGAGFHPDMSGRENIYTNASIFGLSKKEIDSRLDDIIAFSELREFIDNPVRTYSSGMYMRLAFSVAINVDADVLLIDEILAVGDANFQSKCFAKLQEIKANGTTIVIVSHSLKQIEQICNRSIWIHGGKIRSDGVPNDVHMDYLDYMSEVRKTNALLSSMTEEQKAAYDKEKKLRWGNGDATIETVKVTDKQGKEGNLFEVGAEIHFRVGYKVNKPIDDAVFGIGIFRPDGLNVYGTNTRIDGFKRFDLKEDGYFDIVLPKYSLLPSKYIVGFSIEYGEGIPVDYWKTACEIETFTNISDIGTIRLDHDWGFSDGEIKK